MAKPRLLFVSPRFLFPADSGGKIRTGDILRGLKGGAFEVTLVSSEPPGGAQRYRSQLEEVCDRYTGWPENSGSIWRAKRLLSVLSKLPVSVASDISAAGARLISAELAAQPALTVVDFPHASVLMPRSHWGTRSVIFTHNVEAEIFRRHLDVAASAPRRWLWRQQTAKMERFERETLRRFDCVIAVSEKDKKYFETQYGVTNTAAIPTGVDLQFFGFQQPAAQGPARVVFTGSMDWLANVDGIEFFLEQVWPLVSAQRPDAELLVVGRNPPVHLLARVKEKGYRCTFTGFVDDVRPHIHGARLSVIPLRIGSGTRIKAYEAMALGSPVVSTAIGVEGLPLTPGEHYLLADQPEEIARAVVALLSDAALAQRVSHAARAHVEQHFSSKRVAQRFEEICLATLNLTPISRQS